MKKHTEKAVDYFKRHHRNECYITSDGRVFHLLGPANSFAITLKDRAVEHFTREEIEHLDKQDTNNEQNTPETKTQEEQKSNSDEKVSELLTLELISKNYNKMLSLVKHFGLNPKDNKAESLIEVLTEYKSKLENNE